MKQGVGATMSLSFSVDLSVPEKLWDDWNPAWKRDGNHEGLGAELPLNHSWIPDPQKMREQMLFLAAMFWSNLFHSNWQLI